MTKKFMNIEILNIVAAWEKLSKDEEKVRELPLKFRWAIKKNLAVIMPAKKAFEEFRDEVLNELRNKFFDEEHSEEVVLPVTDEDGNEVKDENGVVQTQTYRKIKDEFIEEYKAEGVTVDTKLRELAIESNEYEISTVDMDAFVESLPDDTKLEFEDIEMLSWIDTVTNVVEG